MHLASECDFQLHRLGTPTGRLTVRVLPNGCVYGIETDRLLINQVLASPLAGGVQRLFLRTFDDHGSIEPVEIVGPGAASGFQPADDRLAWSGSSGALHYRATLCLHPDGGGWFIHVEIENHGNAPARCDAILLQDVGLASRGQVRNNELYTSQYLDHLAVESPQTGYVVMTRQNLPQEQDTRPWLMQGCLPRARGFTTDGFDFFGVGFRGDGRPAALARERIGQRVRQYETAYVAIQSVDASIPPGGRGGFTFFARFEPDHPARSSPVDLDRVPLVQALLKQLAARLQSPVATPADSPKPGVFQTTRLFDADDLSRDQIQQLFPAGRHEEPIDGAPGSFFHSDDARHVVLKRKELSLARPHGHILRAGQGLAPDDELMACTCYAAGVFASQLTLGNISLAKLLSGTRDPLNLCRTSGLRIFVRDADDHPWQLLGVPSAFEMALDEARWIYQRGSRRIEVRCLASQSAPAITVDVRVTGDPVQVLVSGEIAAGPVEFESSPQISIDASSGRISIRPDPRSMLAAKQPGLVFEVSVDPTSVDAIGGAELLSPGSVANLPYLAIRTPATRSFACRFTGSIDGAAPVKPRTLDFWKEITASASVGGGRDPVRTAQVNDVLAWFARDAVIHLATPRGLEQPNGGAWGVRDVCQGPVELLLAYGHARRVADILRRVFSQQYDRRGDWPQWFMFPPFESIQSTHSHGDVLLWPLKALCDYLEDSDDGAILDEPLPYTDDTTFAYTARREPLVEHCDRLIARIRQQCLPDVRLPRYGDGDWDD